MLGDLSVETFSERLGERFRVGLEDTTALDLTLTRATPAGKPFLAGGRRPFSIEFVGPPTPALVQGIHPLEHDELGVLEIFLVPLEPGASGPRYEAVFT